MNNEIFDRTVRLIGEAGLCKLVGSRVLVFGLGGVGSYVCEGLVRAGVGELGIVDRDIVAPSNINRQLIALHSTVGRKKTEVTAERLFDINPNLIISQHFLSYDESRAGEIDFSCYDYIVDAIDSLPSKVLIAVNAKNARVPLISSMGTGFRLDPSRLKITDIYSTAGCPLARLMRKQLRNNGIDNLKVLFSDEAPPNILSGEKQEVEKTSDILSWEMPPESQNASEKASDSELSLSPQKQKIIASISFVPSIAGLMIAGEVIRSLIK